MTEVKVCLREITKYVLLLGMGIQIILGVFCCLDWLLGGSVKESGRALGGIIICSVLAYVFLKAWNPGWSRKRLVPGTLGIVTSPMVLQCGLTIGLENMAAFIAPVLFIVCLVFWRKERRKWQSILGGAVLACAVILSCNIGSDASLSAKLAGRFCFPYMSGAMDNIPQDFLDEVGYLELRESLRSSDGIEQNLYPQLMKRYEDAAEADRICLKLARYGFFYSTKNVIGDVLWDYAGYHFPMVVSELRLHGCGGDSVVGYRYGQLMEKTGSLGMVYWEYCVVWRAMTSVFLVVLLIARKVSATPGSFIFMLLFELMSLCFVMQGAGQFDYARNLIAPFIWVSLILNGYELVKDVEIKS